MLVRAKSGRASADSDFDEMLQLPEKSLAKFEVDPDEASKLMAGYRTLQSQVVDHSENHTDED